MKLLILLFIPLFTVAQEMREDNLTVIERLLKSVPEQEQLSSQAKVIASGEYIALKPLLENEILTRKKGESDAEITLISVTVSYSEPFRDGWFSSYSAERTIIITYSVNSTIKTQSVTDTIEIEEIPNLERSGYSFTTGNMVSTPMFGSIAEPIALIVTSAIAVYLFFTVRNN